MSFFIKEHTVSFRSLEPKEKIMDLISDRFDTIGKSNIAENGNIKIDASKYSNFMQQTHIAGNVAIREDKYSVTLKWQTDPNWAIAIPLIICTCGLGIIPTIFFVIMPSLRTAGYCMAAIEKIQRDAI